MDAAVGSSRSAGLEALSDAVLAIASTLKLKPILQRLVHAARELVGARYAAIGVPDGRGGFEEFITSGMHDAEIAAIGPLPTSHGMLDAVLQSTESMRLSDLQGDPRFGGWPANHPSMLSLLGVPIVYAGEVIGAFYLTNKKGAPAFTDEDLVLTERFAAHAAVALTNARFLERSRELSVVEERNRLALDLHDAVNQTLFSLTLTAEAATQFVERDPDEARTQIERVQQLARSALDEMRSLVFQLRPADLGAEGLVPTLRKHAEVVGRAFGKDVELQVSGERRLDDDIELALYRIIQEAINNAVKHAQADRIEVRIDVAGAGIRCRVADDGQGFNPRSLGLRARHLGLTSMEERARRLGGSLRVESAPGEGTTVVVEVPL